MRTGKIFFRKLGRLLLLIFLVLIARTAWAGSLPEVDTTTQPASTNLQDTANFIVFDYSTATFNVQSLPIDRQFSIRVINIPADTVVDSMYFLQVEPRYRYTTVKFKKNGQFVSPAELDTMIVIREIRCEVSKLKLKSNDRIFMISRYLIPNRTYILSLGGHSVTKISAAQRAAARQKLVPLLKNDPYIKRIIRKDFNFLYNNPDASLNSIKLSQDSLRAHLQQLVQQTYPNYILQLPDKKTDTVQYYYTFADEVREIRSQILALGKCLADSPKLQPKFKAINNKFVSDSSRSIDSVLKELKDSLNKLPVQGFCKEFDSLVLNAIDSVNVSLDSTMIAATDSILVNNLFTMSALGATYYVDISKNAQRNVTLDVGGAYSWGMDQFFGYYAINIYFRPIDKNVPLWNTNYQFLDFLGSHMSMVVGLTLTSVAQAKVRSGIVGSDGLILGAGFRLLPWFKVSMGTLVYNRLNPDPLISVGARTHFGLFASASFDLDVKGIFSSIPLINQLILK